jgi:putative (di)nucleoside polyphosphate hydrolase
MPTRHFRAGVGTVIYNDAGQIAIFKRIQPPVGVWELQQGGIDLDEVPLDTLWRELHEEVGLTKNDIDSVLTMPDWTLYTTPHGIADQTIPMLGQAHCWFFLKLKSGHDINLDDALEDEASDFRWTTFDDLIALTADYKRHVYETLNTYFENEINKNPR